MTCQTEARQEDDSSCPIQYTSIEQVDPSTVLPAIRMTGFSIATGPGANWRLLNPVITGE